MGIKLSGRTLGYVAVGLLGAWAVAQGQAPQYTITTVAGTGAAGYSGDGGPAKQAQLNSPCKVAVDSSGNLDIADLSNFRIRQVNSSGTINTIVGDGFYNWAGEGGPALQAEILQMCGLAFDASGNLFFSQQNPNYSSIREVKGGNVTTPVAAPSGGVPAFGGFAGDGGPATAAQVLAPGGLAFDAAGNLFIADSLNNRIRMVGTDGNINTVAGNGNAKFSGDNGPAVNAALYFPASVTVDAAGNLYIADTQNNRIRKVSNGVITTIAGTGTAGFNGDGVATKSQLYNPKDVAVDASGNVYVADYFNHRIRMITPGGQMYTIAGSSISGNIGDGGPATSAELIYPAGVAVGPGGVIYIADYGSSQVRMLTPVVTNPVYTNTYYFPHFALGGGWQTALTYVNYSQQAVTCQTNFYGDSGTPLGVPFGGAAVSTRNDGVAPGGELHQQSTVDPSGPQVNGWAVGQCTGPVKASLLYRLFNNGTATGEAGVNASTTPTTLFVTYAQTLTGLAFANPSNSTAATVTVTALNGSGVTQGSTNINLAPMEHTANNLGPMLGIQNFNGSVQISSTAPIVSLSINAEAYPAFSSLPPGDLGAGTALANGTGQGAAGGNTVTNTYYFPHFALGGGWQTALTYVNYSPQTVTCTTNFFGDNGSPLQISFGGAASASRVDVLPPGGEIHQQSQANVNGAQVGGWATGGCTGPVKASLLFRLFSNGTATGEAGVNASTAPTTKFVTFAQASGASTGLAFANPSATAATLTVIAVDANGGQVGTGTVNLPAGQHTANNIGPLLNLQSFTGSVQAISTVPIVGLSINAEYYPAFSSLPPGDLDGTTALSTGH